MDNENRVCSCCEQLTQEVSRWAELLGKKLLVSRYDWVEKTLSIGILRIHKRPEPWEILRIGDDKLILQRFMTVSYLYGEATKGQLENPAHPFVIDRDSGIVTEILESSICDLIEIMD